LQNQVGVEFYLGKEKPPERENVKDSVLTYCVYVCCIIIIIIIVTSVLVSLWECLP